MSEKSAIGWLKDAHGNFGSSWNPVTGCTKKSPGCANCYMFREYPKLAKRGVKGYAGGTPDQVRCWPERMNDPLKWRRPRRIFVCSMSDLFHEHVPDDFVHRVLLVCVLAVREGHTIIILTKRAERMATFSPYMLETFHDLHCPQERLWWGVSVERQKEADERIPILLQMNVGRGRRVVSYEPALGPADFTPYLTIAPWDCPKDFPHDRCGIDWVIAGGESGPNARPSHPDWFRSVRDQCQAAGVPFFFKQWGEWAYGLGFGGGNGKIWDDVGGDESKLHVWDDHVIMSRIGRRRAGRLLDGREWNEYPK